MNIPCSLLFVAQFAPKLMKHRGGGSILAISSPGAKRVMPCDVAFGASKAAGESLARHLGAEFASNGIRVNAISPGLDETKALNHFAEYQEGQHEVVENALNRTSGGRLGQPVDVAEIATILCSPAAGMICCQTTIIDGGYTFLA